MVDAFNQQNCCPTAISDFDFDLYIWIFKSLFGITRNWYFIFYLQNIFLLCVSSASGWWWFCFCLKDYELINEIVFLVIYNFSTFHLQLHINIPYTTTTQPKTATCSLKTNISVKVVVQVCLVSCHPRCRLVLNVWSYCALVHGLQDLVSCAPCGSSKFPHYVQLPSGFPLCLVDVRFPGYRANCLCIQLNYLTFFLKYVKTHHNIIHKEDRKQKLTKKPNNHTLLYIFLQYKQLQDISISLFLPSSWPIFPPRTMALIIPMICAARMGLYED